MRSSFDLKKGLTASGTTSESPELSEIEIDVEWPIAGDCEKVDIS